jgi:N-acetylglucosamine kinase-like BadF-type ATPase
VRHVIGIDAGGTKTVGMLADERGELLAEARGAGANLQVQGELEVEKVLYGIMERLGARSAAALCLGIAGVDRADEAALVRALLGRLGQHERTLVVNDAAIALVAGAPTRVGIVIVAGTGSIAYGVDARGGVARAGGFGHLLADEGSAYWLGREALRAAVRALDGRGPGTYLVGAVLGDLGIASLDELVPLAYGQGLPRQRLAALAPLVQAAADAGDPVAAALLDAAASELALAARSVAGRLALPAPYPVVLAGGLFRGCPSLAGRVSASLALPGAEPRPLDVEPARGAVALALDLLRS